MKSNFTYTTKTNDLRQRTVHFNAISDTREFLKLLLQLLGMHNFLIHTKQDIWYNGEVYAVLAGINGQLALRIDQLKEVSLIEHKDSSSFNKILEILESSYVFNLEDVGSWTELAIEY